MTGPSPATRRLTRLPGWLAAALLALGGARAEGQRAPALRLPPANASLAEEFSHVIAVRELRDGRVLVSDYRDNRVVVADFATGAVQSIARSGSGPQEFRRADRLFAITGDSTILSDPGNGRWLMLDGDGVVTTVPPDAPAVEHLRTPIGADSLGRMLGVGGAVNVHQMLAGRGVDSFVVLLVHRGAARTDTIARLRPPEAVRPSMVRSAETRVARGSFSIPWWAAGEQAVLFRDGWVAVARLSPYRVEWRSPDGRTIRGAPLPFAPTPIDEREKRAFMERTARRTGRPAQPPATIAEWPDEMPPFSSISAVLGAPSPALHTAPDGRLLILRMPTADAPDTRYDVIDRSGRLVGELILSFNEAIAGFGTGSVYVVSIDSDGIQRLRRHPWP